MWCKREVWVMLDLGGVGGVVSQQCLPPSESQSSLLADSSIKLIGQGESG